MPPRTLRVLGCDAERHGRCMPTQSVGTIIKIKSFAGKPRSNRLAIVF
jgi:hypothetical protein